MDSQVCRLSISASILQPLNEHSTDPYGNYRWVRTTGQLAVTLTGSRSHEIKFGFDGRLHQINYIQTNAPVVSSASTNMVRMLVPRNRQLRRRCHGQLPDGNMNSNSYYEIQFRPPPKISIRVFGQDNWKVNQKLTLTSACAGTLRCPAPIAITARTVRPERCISASSAGAGKLFCGEVFATSSQTHQLCDGLA